MQMIRVLFASQWFLFSVCS